MKKQFLIASMAVALIACGGENKETEENNTTPAETTLETPAEETTQTKTASTGSITDLDIDAFEAKMAEKSGTVLDVRTPEETAQGKLENAIEINFHDADFATKAGELDKEKPVYVYCRSGGRSSQAAEILKDQGYEVYNMTGGFTAWSGAGKTIFK